MSQLARKLLRVFAQDAGFQRRAVFGSLAAGSPQYSTDPAVIQSLSQWIDGWNSAIEGENSPAIEDMESLCFVLSYQLCYLLQQGIAEWNADTTYFSGSMVNSSGIVYVSIINNNLNNALSDTNSWKVYGTRVVDITSDFTLIDSDDYIMVNTNGGGSDITITLPLTSLSTMPIGREFTIKNTGTNNKIVKVVAQAPDILDQGGGYFVTLSNSPNQDSVTVVKRGAGFWATV